MDRWTSGPGTVSFKKFNVHAAPRRAVPPPYRPAPREHLIVFESLGNFLQYCMYNTFFLFVLVSIFSIVSFVSFVCTGPSMNPNMVGKKLNLHAPRDGTAAGRHGGAPREHLIFS